VINSKTFKDYMGKYIVDYILSLCDLDVIGFSISKYLDLGYACVLSKLVKEDTFSLLYITDHVVDRVISSAPNTRSVMTKYIKRMDKNGRRVYALTKGSITSDNKEFFYEVMATGDSIHNVKEDSLDGIYFIL
jgi:hypothetical protein